MDQDICCNILMLAKRQMLVKHIIRRICCCSQQRKFEPIVLMRWGIGRHKILISCLHMIRLDMFLHIDGWSCQQIKAELWDTKARKFLLMDHHNMAMDIFIHKMLSPRRRNTQQGNTLHKDVSPPKKESYQDIYQHTIQFNYHHKMVLDKQIHIIEFHQRRTLMVDLDTYLHTFLLLGRTMYLVSIFGHSTLSNCQHILFHYRDNSLHTFQLYSDDTILARDIP